MRLLDVVSAPWAITPEMFTEVQNIYARHMRGEKLNLAELEARIGTPLNNARQPLVIQDGVAILSIEGVIAKRANLFMQISGGTSTQIAGQQFAKALADDSVKCIILAIDSPGGTVDGTQALADQIFAARGKKPIIAVADGICASAAYWIASAADKIFITGDTTIVGSIGVITTHIDQSARDMQNGVRVTEIKAGKYKQMGSSNAPLGMAEKDAIQSQVDDTYKVFLAAVARNRDVPLDTVKSEMAEGMIFLGTKAIDAGLVDGVATLDQVIAESAEDGSTESPAEDSGDLYEASARLTSAGDAQVANTPEDKQMTITVDKVMQESPDVARALIDKGIAEGRAAGLAEGAKAELARIQSLDALATPGHEALLAKFKADGKTTAPEAAVQILAAERAVRSQKLGDIKADAAEVQVSGAAPPVAATDPEAINPREVSARARVYQDQQAAVGIKVTDSDAVRYVLNQKGA